MTENPNPTIVESIADCVKVDLSTVKMLDHTTVSRLLKKLYGAPKSTWTKLTPAAKVYVEQVASPFLESKIYPMPPDFSEVIPETQYKRFAEARMAEPILPATGGTLATAVRRGLVKSKKVFTRPVEALLRRYKRDKIKIPDLQREFVWNRLKRQLFLAGLFAELPYPNFIFAVDPLKIAETEDLTEQFVIDGYQRMSTLQMFYEGKEKMGGQIPDLAGKRFADLSEDMKEVYLSTDIGITEVVADRQNWKLIFINVNKGGTPLNSIEVRRASFEENELVQALDTLTKNNVPWHELFGKHLRYKGLDAILRAVALHYNYAEYSKPAEIFVDKWCDRPEGEIDISGLEKSLHNVFRGLNYQVGIKSFVASEEGSQVNRGLVDCLIHAGLLMIEKDPGISYETLGDVLGLVRKAILGSEQMMEFLTKDTSGRASVQGRMEGTEKIMEEIANVPAGV